MRIAVSPNCTLDPGNVECEFPDMNYKKKTARRFGNGVSRNIKPNCIPAESVQVAHQIT